jgi:ankyrin repeat protein
MKRARSVDRFERLMEAVMEDKADLVRALLEDGELADQVDEHGTPALMLACQEGQVDCARALLEAGAPVAQARQDDGATALMVACHFGHRECVRELLEAGAPVTQAMPRGTSALMLACEKATWIARAQCLRLMHQWRRAS